MDSVTQKAAILVVDDNPEIREILHILLEGEGFDIVEAETGDTALKETKTQDFDLIILDIMMPGMNGYKTCKEIRRCSNAPILFLSAKSQEGDKMLGFSSGGDDFLAKPFSYNELVSRAKALIRRYQAYGGKGNGIRTENEEIPAESVIRFYNLEINETRRSVSRDGNPIELTDTEYALLHLMVKNKGQVLMEKTITIDPDRYFLDEVSVPSGVKPSDLYVSLCDAAGNVLVDYRPIELDEDKPLPKVIDGTKPVDEYKTNEELYLAGLRVDQFNNARLDYMDFYNEALRRDPMDARVNIEVGKHYLRQGKWDKAEEHLLKAQARLSHDYTRVKDAEALYYLGYLYQLTGDYHQAENNYWAATWTPDYKHPAFYGLAVLALLQNDYPKALDMITQSLYVGQRDIQAQSLKAYILRKMGKTDEARATLAYIQTIDPLDYWSVIEGSFLEKGDASALKTRMEEQTEGLVAIQEMLEVANNYLTIGAYGDACKLLDEAIQLGEPFSTAPLTYYYKAYALMQQGNKTAAGECLAQADKLSPLNVYPLRLEEVNLFDALLQEQPNSAWGHYYYGNLLYYIGQKERALAEWLKSTELKPDFSISLRNVGFAYGQQKDWTKSMDYYDRAIKANPDDALLFTESDKIFESANASLDTRLKRLESHLKTVMKHDDAVMRLLSLYNATGHYDEAIDIMKDRHFHLWEGGGQIHDIYVDSHMLKGLSL